MHRHVRHPEADFGFDGVDAAVLDAIEDFYETAKGIERHAGVDMTPCERCPHIESGHPYCCTGGDGHLFVAPHTEAWHREQRTAYSLPSTTSCPAGCEHEWWTIGDDSYGCNR